MLRTKVFIDFPALMWLVLTNPHLRRMPSHAQLPSAGHWDTPTAWTVIKPCVYKFDIQTCLAMAQDL